MKKQFIWKSLFRFTFHVMFVNKKAAEENHQTNKIRTEQSQMN